MSDEKDQALSVEEPKVVPAGKELADEDIAEVAGGRFNPQPIPPG
jgi:hypothetical protein